MSIELSLCQILCSTCRILPQAQRATGGGGGGTIKGGREAIMEEEERKGSKNNNCNMLYIFNYATNDSDTLSRISRLAAFD